MKKHPVDNGTGDPIVIFDIDCVADDSQRIHLMQAYDWDGYDAALKDDKPRWDVLKILAILDPFCYTIAISAKRKERYREDIRQWFADTNLFEPDLMLLRGNNDYTKGPDVKLNAIENWAFNEARDNETSSDFLKRSVFLILEPSEKAAEVWRDHGFLCWQTRSGP